MDVVVTDKAGNPITGLKQEDFTVFQDGKPQPVRAFEAHVLTPEARKTRVIPTLPPNTYTNLPDSIQDQSWNIVLYDQLNTPIIDQQLARISLDQSSEVAAAGNTNCVICSRAKAGADARIQQRS